MENNKEKTLLIKENRELALKAAIMLEELHSGKYDKALKRKNI
jgi:hypothetical protein